MPEDAFQSLPNQKRNMVPIPSGSQGPGCRPQAAPAMYIGDTDDGSGRIIWCSSIRGLTRSDEALAGHCRSDPDPAYATARLGRGQWAAAIPTHCTPKEGCIGSRGHMTQAARWRQVRELPPTTMPTRIRRPHGTSAYRWSNALCPEWLELDNLRTRRQRALICASNLAMPCVRWRSCVIARWQDNLQPASKKGTKVHLSSRLPRLQDHRIRHSRSSNTATANSPLCQTAGVAISSCANAAAWKEAKRNSTYIMKAGSPLLFNISTANKGRRCAEPHRHSQADRGRLSIHRRRAGVERPAIMKMFLLHQPIIPQREWRHPIWPPSLGAGPGHCEPISRKLRRR